LLSEHVLASVYLYDRWIKEVVKILEYVIEVYKRILVDEDYSRLTSEHELVRVYLDDK
ncbi:hypothetical protein F5882DRAFT_296693, partial [Hyaloscypha sp. PMI_1271]